VPQPPSRLFCCLLLCAFPPLLRPAPLKPAPSVQPDAPHPVQALIERYSADHDTLAGVYTDPLSPATRERMSRFLAASRQQLAAVDFAALDQEGVGQLVKIATERGRKTRPNLKVGICGEHGGEPSSVEFCYRTGLNYVSCSPFRVLTARLAAAQAAAAEKLKVEGGRTK